MARGPWLPRPLRLVALLAAACHLAAAAVVRQGSTSAERFVEEQLGICTSAADRFQAQLLECESMLQQVEANCPGCVKGPVCNCICPTCVPSVWEDLDMDSLPPCTTLAPEEDKKANWLLMNGAFQYPVPPGQVYVDTILNPPTEPPALPFDLMPEVTPLESKRVRELVARPIMALAAAGSSVQVSRKEQVQAELKQCQGAAVEVETKLRSCEEQRRHYDSRLRFLRKGGDPHMCKCQCPPCDSAFGPPPTCNPNPDAEEEEVGSDNW